MKRIRAYQSQRQLLAVVEPPFRTGPADSCFGRLRLPFLVVNQQSGVVKEEWSREGWSLRQPATYLVLVQLAPAS
jgi:hypothetical protein